TCALGMGGQRGGMVNEAGRFPEVCKKSVQAMAADMQGRIRPGFFEEFGFDRLERLSPRELEGAGRIVEPLYAGAGGRPLGGGSGMSSPRSAGLPMPPRSGGAPIPPRSGGLPAGYRSIGWDEALERIAAKMRATGGAPDDTFFYFSGRSSNEAGFLLQLV